MITIFYSKFYFKFFLYKFFNQHFLDESNHNSASAHHNPGDNPPGNPHNKTNSGPVTLYDLRYATEKVPGLSEHSVRVLLNVENWTAWRLKVNIVYIEFFCPLEASFWKNIVSLDYEQYMY